MTDTATDSSTVAARQDDSSIAILPPVQPGAVSAYDALDRHVHAVEKANWLAERMCSSDYVPAKFKGKPGDGAAAILFGAEVGLSPIASLRSVIVIHGMPGFEARTMKAILMGNGYRFRTLEATRELCRVAAVSPQGDEAEAEITLDDCVLEGWVPQPVDGLDHAPNPDTKTDWAGEWKQGRNGDYYVVKGNLKYITSPRTMLIAKATAAVCRDIAPHLLLGMPAVEDFDSYGDATPRRRGERPGGRAGSLRDRARAAAQKGEQEPPLDAETVDDPNEAGPGRDGGNDVGEGAEPSSGAPSSPPPRDQDQPQPKVTAARQKLNAAMFRYLGAVGLAGDERRDDRLIVLSAMANRGEVISSSNDLTDAEVKAINKDFAGVGSEADAAALVQNLLDEWKADQAREAEAAAAGEPAPEPAANESDDNQEKLK